MTMLRSKLVELEERRRQEEIAAERGEAQDVNFGSQIRSYVLHPYTMVKDHRTDFEMGDADRVLDGDLDGFVRAYLLQAAGGGRVAVARDQHNAPVPRRAVVAYGVPRPDALPRARPQGRRRRRPRRCALRSATTRCCSTSRRTRRGSTSATRRRRMDRAPSAGRRGLRGRSGRGSSPTAPRRATTRSRCRSRRTGSQVVVQRNSHASVVDGLVLSGGLAAVGRARVRRRARDGQRRHSRDARARRWRPRRSARAAFMVSPTYYGMAADVAGLRGGRARRRRGAASSTRRGGRTSASTPTCRRRRWPLGADAVLTSTHKIVGSLTQSAMLHVGADSRIDADAARARDPAGLLDQPELAAPGVTGRGAAPARDPRPGPARRGRSPPPRGRARRSTRFPAAWSSGRTWSAGRASRAGTRCASSSTSAGPAAAATRLPTALRDRLGRLRGARNPRDDRARARRRPAGGGARALRARPARGGRA